jgi:large subunit ribosomal protein L5
MSNLKNEYYSKVIPTLNKEFTYKNKHEVPKLEKIVVSVSLGLLAQNKNAYQQALEEMRMITGQHPILTKAKKSVAGFKLREGMPLGFVVTLRREKMYAFLEKLIKLVLPRIRDFRGVSPTQFDKFGNYNLGIADKSVFPEIDTDYTQGEAKRGFNITLVTTAKTNYESYVFLKELGFPFSSPFPEKFKN